MQAGGDVHALQTRSALSLRSPLPDPRARLDALIGLGQTAQPVLARALELALVLALRLVGLALALEDTAFGAAGHEQALQLDLAFGAGEREVALLPCVELGLERGTVGL